MSASFEGFEALADRYKILPRYVDARGETRETATESKLMVLKAMGVRADTKEAVQEAIEAHDYNHWSRFVEPVMVVRAGRLPDHLPFRLQLNETEAQAPLSGLELKIAVRDETGRASRFVHDQNSLCVLDKKTLSGATFALFGVPFPPSLEIGYYAFHLTAVRGAEARSGSMKVVVSPEKTYLPPLLRQDGRLAGLWVSLYGLRSDKNWGIGDFGDLKRLADWAGKALRVSFIGINPLHSLFNRGAYNISPYSPITRLYRNFIYLDIPSMGDFSRSERAKRLSSSREIIKLIDELRTIPEVDYEHVAALKHQVLEAVFDDFLSENWNAGRPSTDRGAAFQRYMDREGRFLDDYAVFVTLDRVFRERDPEALTWEQWPKGCHDSSSPEVDRFRREHWRDVLFQKYLQWQISEQLLETEQHIRERGIPLGIYQDLAMSDDPYGEDQWANPDLYVRGVRIGAPPDDFSQKGQNWGFPPPNMDKMRENGYEFFIQELRNNCRHGGCIRMDHVMRLFHYFWIPEGAEPKDGAYVAARHEELLGILALESVRQQVLIVGEDLGTVQPYVREALEQNGIFSYRLLYFEKDPGGGFKPPSTYPSLALASVTTHDLPTLCGFWQGMDILERRSLGLFPDESAYSAAVWNRQEDKRMLLQALVAEGLLPHDASTDLEDYPEVTGELHNAVVGYLATSSARLMLLNQEDLLKDLRQQNMPGTALERKNWVTRMRYKIEELQNSPEAARFAEMYRNWILKTNRTPHRG